MIRRFLVLIVAVVVLACGGHQKRLEMDLAGDVPFAITNKTSVPISSLDFDATINRHFHAAVMILDAQYGRPGPIQPGQTARFSFAPGQYNVTARAKDDLRGSTTLARLGGFSLNGPTQLVIHETPAPPTDVATLPGFTVEMQERVDLKDKRIAAANAANAQARRDQARGECQRHLSSAPPSPGKIKATGKWRCVLGGVYSGTDYVDLVQLADGQITATVSGADRNNTWTGAVVGETVNFKFAGTTSSGGALKLDASGKAMLGQGFTFTDGGECLQWTLTCTK